MTPDHRERYHLGCSQQPDEHIESEKLCTRPYPTNSSQSIELSNLLMLTQTVHNPGGIYILYLGRVYPVPARLYFNCEGNNACRTHCCHPLCSIFVLYSEARYSRTRLASWPTYLSLHREHSPTTTEAYLAAVSPL